MWPAAKRQSRVSKARRSSSREKRSRVLSMERLEDRCLLSIRPGFDANVLARNDDDSTGLVSLGFSGAINYFGDMYTQLYVNNNGNVTFKAPMWTYTPFGLTTNTGTPIIAPFFADVDTRAAASGVVTYGSGTADGHAAFGVNWPRVGYFAQKTDKLDTFQLVLIERFDTGAGNFDIEFNYQQIQWETGDASSGSGGLGGESARAGFSNGSGNPGTFYEIPGSGVNGAFLDGNPTTALKNINGTGRIVFPVREGRPPITTMTVTAVGVDAGPSSLPTVDVYNADTGQFQTRILAYENTFRGGVRVAVGDVTGDGIPDIITAPGAGRAPQINVYRGSIGAGGGYSAALLTSFNAYAATFRNGVNVAVGDVNGDGRLDVITAAGAGALPEVRVFNNTTLTSTHTLIGTPFCAFANTFRGGVNVAAGDLNNDGRSEIIAAVGGGGPPTVSVYRYTGVGTGFALQRSFNAFAPSFTGGVYVAAGDFNGDGVRDIICGAGEGWLPMVSVFSGINIFNNAPLVQLASFLAYENTFRGGVRVAAKPIAGGTGSVEKVSIWLAPGRSNTTRMIRQATFAGVGLNPTMVDRVFGGTKFLLGALVG